MKIVSVIFLYFLLSLNLIFGKKILAWSQPIFFQGIRLCLAGALLLGILYLVRPAAFRFSKKDGGYFVQIALFFAYLAYLFSIVTLKDLSSARFAFMFMVSPFVTAILSYFLFGRRLDRLEKVSLCIGVIGFLPLLFVGQYPGITSANFFSWAGLQLFLANAAYAYGWILVSILVNTRGYSPFFVTGTAFAGGGIALIITSFLVEGWFTVVPVTDVVRFSSYLLLVILLNEVIVSNLYAYLLQEYSPTFLSFAGALYPLFSAILGAIYFHEKITYNFVVSAIIVSSALYLFYVAERRHKQAQMFSDHNHAKKD